MEENSNSNARQELNSGPEKTTIPVSQANQEQKLTKLTEMVIQLEVDQQHQITLLKSIRGSLNFFVILATIAIVVQILSSCNG